jgi:hypothetical protein
VFQVDPRQGTSRSGGESRPILVLDNRSELSDKLRDIRKATVALISGIPAVSHSSHALAAQQTKGV